MWFCELWVIYQESRYSSRKNPISILLIQGTDDDDVRVRCAAWGVRCVFPDLCFLDSEVNSASVSSIIFGHALLHGFGKRVEMSHDSRQHRLSDVRKNTREGRFHSHFSLVRTTLAFPLISLVSVSSWFFVSSNKWKMCQPRFDNVTWLISVTPSM